MFSDDAVARGAGVAYPIGSPLRPRDVPQLVSPPPGTAFAFDPAFDDPVIVANVQAVCAALPGLVVGAGFPPPAIVAGARRGPVIPGPDSGVNFLGSGAVYDIEKDIGGKVSIIAFAKSIKVRNFFGCNPDGTLKIKCGSKDLEMFSRGIAAKSRPSLTRAYPGGTFMDFLLDVDYDPKIVVGETYYPGANDTWTAFTATTQASVDRFNFRVSVLRQHVADIILNFTETTYWRPMLESADQSDGQSMLHTLQRHFYEDSLVGLSARAAELRYRSLHIVGAEDPAAKVNEVVQGWNELRVTEAGCANFPVSWLALTIALMTDSNVHYSVWRQSGNKNFLLGMTNVAEIASVYNELWSDNRVEWQRNERAIVKAKARTQPAAPGTPGGRGAARAGAGTPTGSRDISKVRCYNCQELGHYANDCPKKDNKDRRKASRSAAWLRAPCIFRGCKGDRKTHSANDCPTKLANDKMSRASDKGGDKANKRARSTARKLAKELEAEVRAGMRKVTFDSEVDTENDEEDENTIVTPGARSAIRRARGGEAGPSRPRKKGKNSTIGRLARINAQCDTSEDESD